MFIKNVEIKPVNLYLLYILLILQVLNYILLKQTNRYGNNYLLWFSILFIICLILLQINLKLNYYLIFVEIFFLSLFLHILFVPVVGLFGSDAELEFYLVKLIYEYGWSLKLHTSITPWPAQHLFINICSEITDISLLTSTRYLPSLVSTLSLFFLFCLNKIVYKQNYVALYNTLFFSILAFFVFFHSLPIRECFGFLIFLAAIFSYLRGLAKNDYRISFISVFLGLYLTICHHFTLLLFILFIFTFWIHYHISDLDLFRFLFTSPTVKFSKLSINYIILIFCGALSYWIFVSSTVFNRLIISIKEFTQFGNVNYISSNAIYPPLINIQTNIFLYSKILVLLVVSLIFIYEVKNNRKKLNIYEGAIFLFILVIFTEWFFTLFGFLKMNIFPERFELFAWAFLLIPLSYELFANLTEKKKSFLKFMSILFVICFVSMNITQYPVAYYDPSSKPNYENGFVRFYHLPQEYSAINWFNGKGNVLADRITEDLLNSRLNGFVYTDDDFFNGNISTKDYNWLIIRKEMFETILQTQSDDYSLKKPMHISLKTDFLINNNFILNKLYSNNEVDIFSFS